MAEKQEEEAVKNRQSLLVDMSSIDVVGQEEMNEVHEMEVLVQRDELAKAEERRIKRAKQKEEHEKGKVVGQNTAALFFARPPASFSDILLFAFCVCAELKHAMDEGVLEEAGKHEGAKLDYREEHGMLKAHGAGSTRNSLERAMDE